MPLPIRNNATVKYYDSDVQHATCTLPAHKETPDDHNGNHIIACSVRCAAPRVRMHNNIVRTIARFAHEAGATIEIEPATAELLNYNNQFSAEECRNLFPAKATRKSSAGTRCAKMRILLEQMRTTPSSAHEDLCQQMSQVLQEAVQDDKCAKGLRLDLLIQLPSGREFAIDVATVHHTKRSTISSARTYFDKQFEINKKFRDNGAPLCDDDTSSPPVALAVKHKTQKYRPLFDHMLAQSHLHLRHSVPDWCPMIFSHAGEMSPAVFEVIETLSALVKANYSTAAAVRPLDGFTPKQAAADYRILKML